MDYSISLSRRNVLTYRLKPSPAPSDRLKRIFQAMQQVPIFFGARWQGCFFCIHVAYSTCIARVYCKGIRFPMTMSHKQVLFVVGLFCHCIIHVTWLWVTHICST